MHKVRTSLIALLICTFCINTTSAFSDVSDVHPYVEAIHWMHNNLIIEGYSDGTFQPEQGINRAEFLKMIYTANFDIDYLYTVPAVTEFSDVPENSWYAPYVKMGIDRGSIQGYPDGTFKPEQTINTAEAIKIIMVEFFGEDYLIGDAYADQPWYMRYYLAALGKNVIPMVTLIPKIMLDGFARPFTRGETAEMLYRVKAVKDNETSQYLFDLVPQSSDDICPDEGYRIDYKYYYINNCAYDHESGRLDEEASSWNLEDTADCVPDFESEFNKNEYNVVTGCFYSNKDTLYKKTIKRMVEDGDFGDYANRIGDIARIWTRVNVDDNTLRIFLTGSAECGGCVYNGPYFEIDLESGNIQTKSFPFPDKSLLIESPNKEKFIFVDLGMDAEVGIITKQDLFIFDMKNLQEQKLDYSVPYGQSVVTCGHGWQLSEEAVTWLDNNTISIKPLPAFEEDFCIDFDAESTKQDEVIIEVD